MKMDSLAPMEPVQRAAARIAGGVESFLYVCARGDSRLEDSSQDSGAPGDSGRGEGRRGDGFLND